MKKELLASSTELVADIAEVGFDTILSDGLLKDIPVLGIAVRLATVVLGVRDALFLRKVATFIKEVETGAEEDQARKDFKSVLSENSSEAKRVGETLLLILDRFNDFEKPTILAKVFLAFLSKKITFQEFRRLAAAIDAVFVEDLRNLVAYGDGMNDLSALLPSGLSTISQTGTTADTLGGPVIYHPIILTELGKLCLSILSQSRQ